MLITMNGEDIYTRTTRGENYTTSYNGGGLLNENNVQYASRDIGTRAYAYIK